MRRCLSCPDAKSCRADGSDSASRLAAILQTPCQLPAAAQQAPPIVDLPPPPPGGVARVPERGRTPRARGNVLAPHMGLFGARCQNPRQRRESPCNSSTFDKEDP